MIDATAKKATAALPVDLSNVFDQDTVYFCKNYFLKQTTVLKKQIS